ncbi:restin-like protein, partial [Reticulomyxa filosa]
VSSNTLGKCILRKMRNMEYKYFEAKFGYGTFVTKAMIAKRLESAKQDMRPVIFKTKKWLKKIDKILSMFETNDTIIMIIIIIIIIIIINKNNVNEGTGIVRYIGQTNMVNAILVGLELTETIENGSDGKFGGKSWTWIFARITDVTTIVKTREEIEKENEKQPETIPDDLEIEAPLQYQQKVNVGDRVTLTDNRMGVVRYVGNTDFAADEMYGIELDGKLSNGHDGAQGNTRYFTTEAGRGVFARRASIISIDSLKPPQADQNSVLPEDVDPLSQWNDQQLNENDKMETIGEEDEDEDEEEPENVHPEVDSYVTLDNGHNGMVRYIGVTDFSKEEEVFGIELDQWDAAANDGSKNGKRYFSCKNGRGMFVKRSNIIKVLKIPKNLRHLDLKELLNDERDVRTGKKLGLQERLKMLEEKEKEVKKEQELEKMIENLQVGDRVELDRGRTGVIFIF